MKARQDLVVEFMDIFEKMIMKLEETDSKCIKLTKNADVTKQELSLIGFIGGRGEVIMREIAEYMEIPYSTATGLVDKLTQRKFLKRINSSTDRRTVKVCLTSKKGVELFENFMKFRYEMGGQLLSILDEKDLKDVERIMKKLTASLEAPQQLQENSVI